MFGQRELNSGIPLTALFEQVIFPKSNFELFLGTDVRNMNCSKLILTSNDTIAGNGRF